MKRMLKIYRPAAWLLLFSLLLAACSGSGAVPNTGATGAAPATSQPLPTLPQVATLAPGPDLPTDTVTAPTLNAPVPTQSTAEATPISSPTGAAQAEASAIACTAPASPTVPLTEGPYFKAGSPEQASLWEAGMPGIKLVLTGTVLDTNCQPVAGALLDFWQADAQGQYDNNGYTLRGHQFTDQNGRYRLETVVPGEYPGRTEHIHFKVQAPNGPVITSQLFFPGVNQNDSDRIFDQSLLINVQSQTADEMQATYNFVVNTR